MSHPPPSAAFDLVVALPDSARPVLRHLLSCRRCRRRAAQALEPAPGEVRAAFASSTGTVVPDEVESAQVRRFLARRDAGGEALLALPPEEAARQIEEDGRFRSWGLAWRLALASDELAAREVEEAARLARLLAEVAERLDTAVPATVRAELLVRAGTNLGAARRLAGRFEEAETVLLAVARHLPEDSAERAAWCRALGLLRRDQERPDEALALLSRAVVLYARAGEPASAAAASVEEAWTLLDDAEPEHAAALLEAALGQLDPATQPAAVVRAWQGLGWAHAEPRDSVAARRAFREAHLRLLALAKASPLRARLLWRQAELAARVGEVAQAEATFAAAREELERAGLAYEAVRAGLDLARWLVEQGRSEDLAPLAVDLGRLAAGFAAEPLAAVASLRHAVAHGTVTVEAIAHIAEFLHRARSDRGLRFVDPPAAETPTAVEEPPPPANGSELASRAARPAPAGPARLAARCGRAPDRALPRVPERHLFLALHLHHPRAGDRDGRSAGHRRPKRDAPGNPRWLRGRGVVRRPGARPPHQPRRLVPGPDLREIRGQETARRALEVAAAGGHSLLLVGPTGAGKTLLARCLPGLLPPLTAAERRPSRRSTGKPGGQARRVPFPFAIQPIGFPAFPLAG